MENQIRITQKEYPLTLNHLLDYFKKQGYSIESRTNEKIWGITYMLTKQEERTYTLEEMKKAFDRGRNWELYFGNSEVEPDTFFEEFLKTL